MQAVTRIGSDYGGWNVVLDLIPDGAVIISAGIGNDITFDRWLIDNKNAFVAMVDPGLLAYNTLAGAGIDERKYMLDRSAVCDKDGSVRFGAAISNGTSIYDSGRGFDVSAVSIDTLLAKYSEAVFLKMDIEGAEFDAIAAWSFAVRPAQVAVGFHPHKVERLIQASIDRMVEHGYEISSRVTEDVEDMILFVRSDAWPVED